MLTVVLENKVSQAVKEALFIWHTKQTVPACLKTLKRRSIKSCVQPAVKRPIPTKIQRSQLPSPGNNFLPIQHTTVAVVSHGENEGENPSEKKNLKL